MVQGGLFGVACGDALGATLEFLPKNGGFKKYGTYLTDIIGGGFMNLKPGEVTDDTDMTIAVAKGILENPKKPKESIGKYFMEWYDTDPKDMGITCRKTMQIYRYLESKKMADWDKACFASHNQCGKSAGNGTLMRCIPVALYYNNIDDIERFSRIQSEITHYEEKAAEACIMYNTMVHEFMLGRKNKTKVITENVFGSEYLDVLKMEYTDLDPTGYVVDSFKCALWAFLNTNSFKECVCMAANLCGDADTIAAIAGGMAGVYYGIGDIPKAWIERIVVKEELYDLANELNAGRK